MASTIAKCFTAAEKLSRLRAVLAARGVSAYVVPSSDAHNSEYVADRDKRRAYISGFTGSAGTAVVTTDAAKLWTDGRYYAQAALQLDAGAGWGLMRDRLPETPSIEAWLASVLKQGDTVGLDPFLFPLGQVRRMEATLKPHNIAVLPLEGNLVDEVWAQDAAEHPDSPVAHQPPAPATRVLPHPVKYAGQSHEDKLAAIRGALTKAGADALLVCALDEVCWLLNIRGSDVQCNPVTIAYAVVTKEGCTLFVDEAKVDEEVRAHLTGVTIMPYGEAAACVRALPGRIWLDPSTTNYAMLQAALAAPGEVDASKRVLEQESPIPLAKSLKNAAEIEGFKNSHVRDAVALVSFLAWLEIALTKGVDMRTGKALAAPLTEFTAGQVLDSMRAEQADYVSPSFETIAGYGPNGAIIHYRAEEGTAATLGTEHIFLLDSGGQYRDGTTDVTRTLHFGTPTDDEKLCYTAVLKGHIGMSTAVFPSGASGVAIDAMARAPLWKQGLDYRHGTGHGVGSFLNVHEGPQGVANAARNAYQAGNGLVAGMTITDEPGYYRDGAFGIRIENVLLTVQARTPHNFGDKGYCAFQPLTVVPITTKLVDVSALTAEERKWLNDYNAWCRATLAPIVKSYVLEYLLRETYPV